MKSLNNITCLRREIVDYLERDSDGVSAHKESEDGSDLVGSEG